MDLSTIFKSLKPIILPLVAKEWDSQLLPMLQAEAAKVTNPYELALAEAGVAFLDAVVRAELKALAV